MTHNEIKNLAKIWSFVAEMHAVNTRVESMKQLNEERRSRGYSDGYVETDFVQAERDLMEIADNLKAIALSS